MRKNLKKAQKRINKIVNEINKDIKDDWLWNGRFYFHQLKYKYYPFSDRSGGMFHVIFRAEDRKTGFNYDYGYTYLTAGGITTERIFRMKMYENMNAFIIEKCNVWAEQPDPREQAKMEGRYPE